MTSTDAVNDVDEISESLKNLNTESTADDVLTRHRRERKDLQAKIQALKKNAPKSDKKKRKEIMEEVARIDEEMERRHNIELKAVKNVPTINNNNIKLPKAENAVNNDDGSDAAAADDDKEIIPTQRISKAQKRREKKERQARQREEELVAAVAAADSDSGPRAIENRQLIAKLKKRQLDIHQVPSDGDCLYNSISHQLQYKTDILVSVKDLRDRAAAYIEENKDSLMPYMIDLQTGDSLDDKGFKNYCDALRNSHAWGGQIELKALSSVFEVRIEIIQAEGPTTVQGEEFIQPVLVITYHRHLYQLGEHYNSTKPLQILENNFNENGHASTA